MPLLPGNILTLADQSFESGIGSWIANSNCSLTTSSFWAQDGSFSLQLTSTAAGDMSAQANGPGFAGYPVDPTLVYTIEGWVHIGSGSSDRICFLYVNWFSSAPAFISNNFYGGLSDASVANQILLGGVVPPTVAGGATADAASAVVGLLVQGTGAAGETHLLDIVGLLAPTATRTIPTVEQHDPITRRLRKRGFVFTRSFQPQPVVFAKSPQPIVVKHELPVTLRDSRAPVIKRNPFFVPDFNPTAPIVIQHRIVPHRSRLTIPTPNAPTPVIVFTKSPTPLVVNHRVPNQPKTRITTVVNTQPIATVFTKGPAPIVRSSQLQMRVARHRQPIVINPTPHGGPAVAVLPPIGHHKHHRPRREE